MDETDRKQLDNALKMLEDARDIIGKVKANQFRITPYHYLQYALDKIEDAELDIADARNWNPSFKN